MKVVTVNDFGYVNGGAGQVVLSSERGLANRHHQVTVFSAVQSPAEPMPLCRNLAVLHKAQQAYASELRAAELGGAAHASRSRLTRTSTIPLTTG